MRNAYSRFQTSHLDTERVIVLLARYDDVKANQ